MEKREDIVGWRRELIFIPISEGEYGKSKNGNRRGFERIKGET